MKIGRPGRAVSVAVIAGVVASAVASPAHAAAVTVKGTVSCSSGGVVGVWVQSSGGGSRFASLRVLPGNAKVGGYAAKVNPGTVELHVGCGGSSSDWASDQYTTKATVTGSRVLNAYCTGAAGTFKKVTCSFPPRRNLTPVPPDQFPTGQCTYWAASRWKEATRNMPTWPGDAMSWDDNARAQKWRVQASPAPRSVVVWEKGTTGGINYGSRGHVAWVESIAYRADGWYLTVTEMNVSRGTAIGNGARRSVVKHVSGMDYIHAPG